jgi:spermidine/putrescine-binding protein
MADQKCRTGTTVARLAFAAVLAGLGWTASTGTASARGALNVLTWCDHEDAALLSPLREGQ